MICKKIKLHCKNICTCIRTTSQNHIPHPEPMPTDSPKASGPRKRKLSTKVTTNGNPVVERKRQRSEGQKQTTTPALTNKQSSTRAPAKTKTTTKAVPAKPATRRPLLRLGTRQITAPLSHLAIQDTSWRLEMVVTTI